MEPGCSIRLTWTWVISALSLSTVQAGSGSRVPFLAMHSWPAWTPRSQKSNSPPPRWKSGRESSWRRSRPAGERLRHRTDSVFVRQCRLFRHPALLTFPGHSARLWEAHRPGQRFRRKVQSVRLRSVLLGVRRLGFRYVERSLAGCCRKRIHYRNDDVDRFPCHSRCIPVCVQSGVRGEAQRRRIETSLFYIPGRYRSSLRGPKKRRRSADYR